MKCPLQAAETAVLLLDYSAGRLDAANAALVRNHVSVCAACSAFHSEQTELWSALDLWQPEPVGGDFNRGIRQKMDALTAEPWYVRFAGSLRRGAWKPAFPLAAAVVVIAAGFVLDHKSVTPGSPAHVSIHEADQVEKALDDLQLLRQLDVP